MSNVRPDLMRELQTALERLPRVPLAFTPTPLQHCPRLTEALHGPQIWIKRDDLTEMALSGNKSRMLEYVLGEAKAAGVDAVVAGAAVQSNYTRQLAAACARLGIACHLVLQGVRGSEDSEVQGNLLLDLLLGAEIELLDASGWVALRQAICSKAGELTRMGRNVRTYRVAGDSTLGLHACGYVQAAIEIVEQARGRNVDFDEIWVCSSDTTHAGLAIAFKHMEIPVRIVGVPALPEPVAPGRSFEDCIARIGNDCAEILQLRTRLDPCEIISLPGYCGPEYGVLTDAARDAIRMLARLEAILADPVYTGKALGALIDHIRRGLIPHDRTVCFVHTGGFPALFAYAESLGLGAPAQFLPPERFE